MRRHYIPLLLFLCFTVILPLNAEHRRDHVRIETPDEASLLNALSLGLDIVYARPGAYIEVLLSPDEHETLQSSGLRFKVLRQDVGRYLAERSRMHAKAMPGFGDGSMGGFYTFDETLAILDSLITNDPHGIIAGLDTIGTTHYGRPIVMFTVSDNPELDEGEPEVIYDGLHHAREPMGMMNLLYFLEHLLDNYGIIPQVTYLVDNRKLWFVPVVNPDGYAINESIYLNTDDFGFWSKNARDNNENGIIDDYDGVDINRNYGYMWGYDDYGSSPEPSSSVYRGPFAFSEPETWTIKDLCESRLFLLGLNYHTFSDLLIYPFGYNDQETPDSLTYRELAEFMTELNNYQFGTGTETVNYVTNGDADDWMYGEQITKNKILSMTPEVGNSDDFFWPPPERIVPLAEANLYPNIFLALAAGSHIMFTDRFQLDDGDGDGYPEEGEAVDIIVVLKNVGISQEASGVTCELSTSSPSVSVTKSTSSFGDAAIGQEIDNTLDPFSIQIADSIVQGEIASLFISISADDGYVNTDSFDILLGTPKIIFADGAEEGMVNFSSNTWDISPLHVSEGVFAFTDSPTGDYSSNTTSIMTGLMQLDLSGAVNAYLIYDSRWEIEKDWDFGQVEVSRDGSTWEAMEATRTFAGSGFTEYHDPAEEGYHSRQITYVHERVNLSDFLGPGNEAVSFRFILRSDGYIEFDGWYVDEIKVLAYGIPTGIDEDSITSRLPIAFRLGQNYPNPFNPLTTITFDVPGIQKQKTRLSIYDVRGRLIRVLLDEPLEPGRHVVTWDGRADTGEITGSGIYIYKLDSGGQTATRKMVLLR
ncbi:MAG: M14 family zinc carboxypeptidase [Candidatus Glassbacteria bacterium]